ncbi:tRNA(Ile)-lysidine synthetase [Colwellia sp. MT41]|uniref:tRNA lysidine(34) synthetase TilS n=1 Tax=Colwellia sp. MT41 TaxID=58049 RepID=UPI000717AFEE|nr:tRNA lysidine(34) synthetase TilS [Colwellia sp. MT41]ALO34340.1 tRNA(Ile)-lysidine synthetase [Colwellia sp. MT41]
MQKISSVIHATIKQYLQPYGDIELIIAYSGGVDSQVLLHAIAHLKQNKVITNTITVCHVNHGLSDNASSWQEFAQQECLKLSFNLIVKKVQVQVQAQHSLEALAREARYQALRSVRHKKSLILTGHHSDDQSETFLLALKRGAGLKGLAAMAVVSQLGQHLLLRPLLAISRQEIEAYAKAHQLSWVEDESNLDTCFDRNFIRQQLMPLLRQRWPSISNTINRSASHCLAGQELLDELAEQDLSLCRASEESLHIEQLTLLSIARFNNLIRFFMAQHACLMPTTEQVKQVRLQLAAGDDKNPQIKVGLQVFRRFKGQLFLTPDYNDISDWQGQVDLCEGVCLQGNRPQGNGQQSKPLLTLPDNLGELVFNINSKKNNNQDRAMLRICLPKQGQQVSVRFSHQNPKCLPDFRQHSRKLKKVLQELNIAPWQRKRIAFLYYDSELVAAIGHFICQPFIANDSEAGMLISSSVSDNH